MRFSELDPTWIERAGRVVGVRFVCPMYAGAGPHHSAHAICVLFANPPDGGAPWPADAQCPGDNDGKRWTRAGETFADLSLSPSIDCTTAARCLQAEHSKCPHTYCWHGHITSGQVRP